MNEASKKLAVRPARFEVAKSPEARLRQRFPTVAHLREHARRRVPRFGFEAVDGGAGEDRGVLRNAAALDAIELMPRYGVDTEACSLDVELFGRRYAVPFGVAPMGMVGIVWPSAEKHLAQAARAGRFPYVASTVASSTVEELAVHAEEMLWFQLYRLSANDHAAGFDLVRRAEAAGARVLVMSLDTPVRTKRPRETRQGLVLPFHMQPRTIWDALTSPAWLLDYLRHGLRRFGNYEAYASEPTPAAVSRFAQTEAGGAFTWSEVARYRERWRGSLVVKGILHPEDAAKALAIGVDGIQVSNHGGRQNEGLVAPIDALPAIVAEVGQRATVLMDGGIRSGLDVARALALGARAVFIGKAFLYAVGAIGRGGAAYLAELLREELIETLRQVGVSTPMEALTVECRHPGVWVRPRGAVDLRSTTI